MIMHVLCAPNHACPLDCAGKPSRRGEYVDEVKSARLQLTEVECLPLDKEPWPASIEARLAAALKLPRKDPAGPSIFVLVIPSTSMLQWLMRHQKAVGMDIVAASSRGALCSERRGLSDSGETTSERLRTLCRNQHIMCFISRLQIQASSQCDGVTGME